MKFIAISLIQLYRYTSGIKDGLLYSAFGVVSGCKHSPTCSQYAILQIEKHGTITGLRKGLWRIIHCY